jgi:hypothetical protein
VARFSYTRPMLARVCLFGVLSLAAEGPSFASPTPGDAAMPGRSQAGTRLRVFLDCGNCFADFLRDEITWVDFVRQPQDADVHILSSDRETGGGGRELVLRFVGRGRFADAATELRVVSQVAASENERRAQVLRTVAVGLLGYAAREGLPSGLDISVRPQAAVAPRQAPAAGDRWNLWVFSVGTGASLDAEEANREVQWNLNLTADRITDRWKLAFGAGFDEQRQTFDLDEDDPLEVKRTERNAEWFVARSLGPHWSLGFDGEAESSTFDNTSFSVDAAPAVEFSVFPYEQYATRQLVVQYQLGVEHARYTEVTLFDRLKETRARHELSANLDQRQPWGSVEAGIEWSQYLHDRSKYRLEVDGELSLRIVRGLSVEFEANASRIRDQLSLPRRSATSEEVLLRLRELQSGYEVSLSVGVTYSFGSLFNNVVNPRFGDRGN